MLALLAFATLPMGASAAQRATAFTGDYGIVDGVWVFLGVMPSEILRGHPATHPEASMHGGPSGRSGEHHVLISLFDANKTRLENMQVLARVGEYGLSAAQKQLEPMQFAGTVTYGNFFAMPKPGPYSIELDWRVKGEKNWSHAVFI
ncbi:MAG: hypothetical protein ABI728_12215, partial [Betaproteobacteria bacterium]